LRRVFLGNLKVFPVLGKLAGKPVLHDRIFGTPIYAGHLVWVILEVEEFPLIDIILIKPNQFIASIRNPVVSTDPVVTRILIVVIIKAFTPVLGRLSFKDRDHRATVQIGWSINSGDFAKGAGKVDWRYDVFISAACLYNPGPAY
jgi:hypothetical protein